MGNPLGVSEVTEVGIIQYPGGEVLGITLVATEISKLGADEGSGLVLSGVSVEVTWVDNLEGSGHIEGETLVSLEGTRVGNKLGISDGEVMGK